MSDEARIVQFPTHRRHVQVLADRGAEYRLNPDGVDAEFLSECLRSVINKWPPLGGCSHWLTAHIFITARMIVCDECVEQHWRAFDVESPFASTRDVCHHTSSSIETATIAIDPGARVDVEFWSRTPGSASAVSATRPADPFTSCAAANRHATRRVPATPARNTRSVAEVSDERRR